jgi:RNA polymerase sigma factor (sigma-70 family)
MTELPISPAADVCRPPDPPDVVPDIVVRDVLSDLTFDDLYRTEYDGMVRVAYLMVGEPQAAEEIVQDAFVATHVRWRRLASPGGYLRTCVMNKCRDRLRRRTRFAALIPLLANRRDAEDTSNQPSGAGVELHDVLLALPLRQRAAIVGRFYCGWDDQTLAEALGVRPATVRSLIHRGLSALRIELTP